MAGIMRRYGGRQVWVHVPPSVEDKPDPPRHLLLLHDGQNLTSARPEALGGSWLADEVVDRLAETGEIPPLVIAGIDHAGEGRIDEFAAMSAGRPNPLMVDYAELVLDAIVPALKEDFNVRTDFDGVALGGSSMGGLATVWMAAMYPRRFGRLIAMSPSVWWGRRAILRLLRSHPIDPATRIWIDAGVKEGARVVRDAFTLADRLRLQGVERVKFVKEPTGRHDEASWARRLPEALRWLYSES
jgi:enterochelin esterase-like enzyme